MKEDDLMDLNIKISRNSRRVYLSDERLGMEGENLQGNIIFEFVDEFVDGVARLEYSTTEESNYIILTKTDNKYIIPIKNVLTQQGRIYMQLVITEQQEEEGIPIFKSNKFYIIINSSINAVTEAPEGYESWIDIANAKIIEIDNLDNEIQENENQRINNENQREERFNQYEQIIQDLQNRVAVLEEIKPLVLED